MDVSIVIPFYENVGWLYEAVNSIHETSGVQYEIIIIDDGSEEKIDFNRFHKNSSLITTLRQTNQGPGKARNIGLSRAKGDYIAFLDSDDKFIKNKLTKQLSFMKSKGFVWTHTSYERFLPNGKEIIVRVGDFQGQVFPICLAHNPIATPTVMVKKDVLDELSNPFSEDMRYGQDGYLWFRLAVRYPLGVIDEPLTKVRIRGTNTSLRAYNHLYTKAYLHAAMTRGSILKQDQNVPSFLKFLYSLSARCYHFVEKKFSQDSWNTHIELFSKFLYLPIYLSFRLYYRLHKQ